MTTAEGNGQGATMLDDIPRLLRREWKHKKPHLQRSTSLPVLAPAPHFQFILLDRPARPVFTCFRCGFSNTLLDMCLWCCWTSPEAKAAWAESEKEYLSMKATTPKTTKVHRRTHRKISAPPRIHWHPPHPPPVYKYAHPCRRSEPPPTRFSGMRLELSSFVGSWTRSVSSRHHNMKSDDGETPVAGMWGTRGVTAPRPYPSSIYSLFVAAKTASNTSLQRCDAGMLTGQTVAFRSPGHGYCTNSPRPVSTNSSYAPSRRASSVRIVLPERRAPSLDRPSTSTGYESNTISKARSRALYTLSRRTILEPSPSTHAQHQSSPSSSRLSSKIPRIRIPSTFTRTSTSSPATTASSPSSPSSTASIIPTTSSMTIVHDYNHDKYTHDNANNIHVASSAPMADHFLHSDTRAYVYNESIFKKSEHEGSGLSADSVDRRSFMDLSAEVSVERTLVEVESSGCSGESPPPKLVFLPSSPVIEGIPNTPDSTISFPVASAPAQTVPQAQAATKPFHEACDAPPVDEVQATSLKGRRARERASAPPPTLHGLQFLDLSDGTPPSVPFTHGKSHSLGGLPVRARSQGNRKKEARRLPRPEIIDSTASQQREGDVVTATNDRAHTHGRSKSQPTSSVRLGNPRRPYYSAIRPHMGVGTSLSQPSSPIRANYDSRPASRGAASRPGSSAAYLSPSYPTSRASSPAPSYMHAQVRSKSFLDIDVLDDEDYLFSSLTPPSTLPAVYAQAYSPSEINIHRTGMSFGGIGLGLGNGVFGSPEVAIGPRPTSSLGFRESTSTTRGDCGDSLREMSRFGSTRRLGKTRFSLSRVWKWKEPATQGDFSSRTDDIVPSDVDENGVRRSKHHLASDLGKLRDMGKDAGRKGVEGVAESMKKVGRSLRGLKSFVDRRSK